MQNANNDLMDACATSNHRTKPCHHRTQNTPPHQPTQKHNNNHNNDTDNIIALEQKNVPSRVCHTSTNKPHRTLPLTRPLRTATNVAGVLPPVHSVSQRCAYLRVEKTVQQRHGEALQRTRSGDQLLCMHICMFVIVYTRRLCGEAMGR